MKPKIYIVILILLEVTGCNAQKSSYIYESENLKIEQLATNTYMHVSYLETKDFGNVACNGMIVADDNEALIFDTPVNDSDSAELIVWIINTLKCNPKGVVVTHFHSDCLGGLNEFHKRDIPSYACTKTIDLAKSTDKILPLNGFNDSLELNVGNLKVLNAYLGKGHTADNIVAYFPSEKVLFGGCLIKSEGAGKGNLEDASPADWSDTVRKVKMRFADAEIIIPGHGKSAGPELLDYTIDLFSE